MKLKDYFNFLDNQKSFTLIELLVVIAIIGLLASLIFVNLSGTRSKANIAKGLQFSQSVHHALGSEAIGVWSFDEGSGTTTNDSSGYGNHGTIHGVNYTTDTPSGQGYALSFDGVDDYVHTPTSIPEENFTFSLWFKLNNDAKTRDVWQYLLKGGWALYQHSANNYIYFYSGGARYISWVPSNNKWHHLACAVTDAGESGGPNYQANCYADSQLKALNQSGYLLPSTYLQISYLSTNSIDGLIDEVRIYEKALETAEVEALYYAGLDNLLVKGLIDEEEYQERLPSIGFKSP